MGKAGVRYFAFLVVGYCLQFLLPELTHHDGPDP